MLETKNHSRPVPRRCRTGHHFRYKPSILVVVDCLNRPKIDEAIDSRDSSVQNSDFEMVTVCSIDCATTAAMAHPRRKVVVSVSEQGSE